MNRTIILEAIRKNVDLLSSTCLPDYQYIPLHQRTSPSVAELHKIMSLLQKVIFPGFFGTEEEAQTDSIAPMQRRPVMAPPSFRADLAWERSVIRRLAWRLKTTPW